jgi:hypothetical protein
VFLTTFHVKHPGQTRSKPVVFLTTFHVKHPWTDQIKASCVPGNVSRETLAKCDRAPLMLMNRLFLCAILLTTALGRFVFLGLPASGSALRDVAGMLGTPASLAGADILRGMRLNRIVLRLPSDICAGVTAS